MRIVYTGAFDEVEVPYVEDGTPKWFRAKPGQPVECPYELAAGLLEQTDTWKRMGPEQQAEAVRRRPPEVDTSELAEWDAGDSVALDEDE